MKTLKQLLASKSGPSPSSPTDPVFHALRLMSR